MRCKLDENMPIDAAQLLRAAGHECDSVYDEALSGARDESVIGRCLVERRALVTLDLDLADIRAYPPGECHGIENRVRIHRDDEPGTDEESRAREPER